jgi:hypothetical protein
VRLPHLYPLALLNKLLSDVCLAALLNIPITAQTLITILTQTRDVDMTVCRLVCGGHPCALTIAQHECGRHYYGQQS